MRQLCVFILSLSLCPVLAHGATYYVGKTGSDTQSCMSAQSASTPKGTINGGASCLSAEIGRAHV